MSRRSRRDEQRRTGRKPPKDEELVLNKDLLLKLGIGVVIAAVIAIVAMIWFYRVPTVARVNGARISADDVSRQMRGAEDNLVWDYVARFPNEMDIDYDRDFGGGITFGRVIREEAVRMAALTNLHMDYINELDLHLRGDETPEDIQEIATYGILANPHIFARFEPYMTVPDTEPTDDLAQEILARAHAGEDFDMLIQTYGEDPGMEANPEGYSFISGVMVPEFEAATRALAIGEISGLVPSQFGYHIIKRVEPNPDNAMTGQFGFLPEGEEVLGAKHILIFRSEDEGFVDHRREAIYLRFDAMINVADLVLLGALAAITFGSK